MALTTDQEKALRKVIRWYYDTSFNKNNLFTISGFAGCGKTWLTNVIINILGLPSWSILIVTFTNKAADIVRRRGLQAATIHKTFYNIHKGPNGRYYFKLKSSLPSSIKLIIIDEFSMVNDDFLNDIMSFGIYTIALGDTAQLPPVIGKNSILDDHDKVDAHLTQIVRQQKNSPILDLATMARNHETPAIGGYGNCNVFYMKDVKNILEYDVILCYKNETRFKLNNAIRLLLKRKSKYPEKGDKLVCTKTNYFHKIDYNDMPILSANGLPLIALEDARHKDNYIYLRYKPDFVSDDLTYFATYCNTKIFEREKYKDMILLETDESHDNVVDIDYGFCVSYYKSQGGEYDNVLVIMEHDVPSHIYYKALYTAITRAKKKVDIVLNYY